MPGYGGVWTKNSTWHDNAQGTPALYRKLIIHIYTPFLPMFQVTNNEITLR